MQKNNYSNYAYEHKNFLHYLLSFAMEQYQDEDPILSHCAKELLRYVLDMDETETVAVTKFETDAVPGFDVDIVYFISFDI